VAALLYTLLDFANSEMSMIPDSLTCTQVAQKWYMPSTANMTLSKAVKFNDVSFQMLSQTENWKRLSKVLLGTIIVQHHQLLIK